MTRIKIGSRVGWVGGGWRGDWSISKLPKNTGQVISRRTIPTYGNGIPIIPGHYKPMDSKDLAIIYDDGSIDTATKNQLIPISS